MRFLWGLLQAKVRAHTGMHTDAMDDVYGDDDLFSLKAIKVGERKGWVGWEGQEGVELVVSREGDSRCV